MRTEPHLTATETALLVNALREKANGDSETAALVNTSNPSLAQTLRVQALACDKLADEIEAARWVKVLP